MSVFSLLKTETHTPRSFFLQLETLCDTIRSLDNLDICVLCWHCSTESGYKECSLRKRVFCIKTIFWGVYKYKLWWCLSLGALVFAFSCNQANDGGGQSSIESNEITITIKGDAGVEVKSPASFKVKTSSNWKDIKEKAIKKIKTKENKEIKEWRLKDEKGAVLQDSTTFEKNETVFAITKDEESPKPPAEKITITVEADAGYTFKETTRPCTIEVEKNTTWTSLKPKTKEKIELLKDYEEAGWKLGGKDGGYIEDTYTFSANTIIYATSKKKGEPETPKVTITVNGDNGVEVVSPNNFKVDKGSKWESIKNQAIGKLKIKAHFEVIEWHLTKSTGTLITDQTEFKENGVVFAVSKEKAKAKYKVEHHQQNLLNGGYTKKETEEKEGFVGEETRAEAKKYPGFTANTFS